MNGRVANAGHAWVLAAMVVALAARVAPAQDAAREQSGEAVREAAYAQSIMLVADSAIHRLDFFPSRLQLRMQMLFLMPRDSTAALFAAIGARSLAEAVSVDDVSSAFERTPVPDDLHALHGQLITSLHAARGALAHLATASNACAVDATSVSRCQAPFTSASSALGKAYASYLDARRKIGAQITDTRTVLSAFTEASTRRRAPPAPPLVPTLDGSDAIPVVFLQERLYLLSELDRRADDARRLRRPSRDPRPPHP